VKTGDNIFGECLQHNYLLLFVFLYVIGALLEGAKIGTASFLHCTERDDYTDKCYVD
jgi:hypothetical protein